MIHSYRGISCILATLGVFGCGSGAERSGSPLSPSEYDSYAGDQTAPSAVAEERKLEVAVRFDREERLAGVGKGLSEAEAALLEDRGAVVVYRFRTFAAAVVVVDEAGVEVLSRVTGVRYARVGTAYRAIDDVTGWQWPYSGMNFPPAPSANSGAGLKIGVIDTGVDCSHPDLASRCGTGFSFIADGSGPYQDDCCYEGQTRITDGHGTEVAGIIAASLNGTGTVAPAYSASIHPYRVCDRYANCTCLNAAMAVDSAVSAGMHLVNMSLTWPYPEYQLQCQILEDAIEVAYGVGVPVIVSTGNAEGTVLPSVYSTTIAVSGVHCTNYGFLLMSCGNRSDVRIQPGTSPASYYDLAAASEYVWAPRPVVHGGGSILFGGTSAATPIVTSAVAIAMQKWPDSRFQSQAIVQHLRNTAWQTVDHDPMRLGAGVLDATAFLAQSACAIYTCYPHFDP